jgi:hypothetical protein
MRAAVLLRAATPAFRVDASGVETPVFWLAPSGLSLGVLRMNDATVRRLVRDRIADGRLPRNRGGAVSATNGTDEGCDACSTPVSPEEVLYRVAHEGFRQIRVHATCFAIWRDERNKMTSGLATLD